MNRIYLLLFIMVTAGISLFGQVEILDNYVRIGLLGNLSLQQKEFSLQKSLAALDEARGMFMPSIIINARYTRAEGGRKIDLPIGDLMNPVYAGLNQLIGSSVYPSIDNQQIDFLRRREHETKVSLVQPIFTPQIFFNYGIKSDITEISEFEKNLYKRDLIAMIKTAYYNYNKTLLAIKIFEQAEELLKENLRVNNSLYENQKVTKDAVYRAEAELSEIQQQKAEAEKNNELAKFYFNFILNRDLNSEILVSTQPAEESFTYTIEETTRSALQKREELNLIVKAIEIADKSVDLARSNYLPSLIFAADYGFQGEDYKFSEEYDYWMASLVLKWNLFNGFQDKAKAEQSQFEKAELESKLLELQRKIVLQVTETYKSYEITKKNLESAALREKSSTAAFEIVQKKYNEGMASMIEFIDARGSLTRSRLNKVLTQFDLFIKIAELEKVSSVNHEKYFIDISEEK